MLVTIVRVIVVYFSEIKVMEAVFSESEIKPLPLLLDQTKNDVKTKNGVKALKKILRIK